MSDELITALLRTGYFRTVSEARRLAWFAHDHVAPDDLQQEFQMWQDDTLCPHCTLLVLANLGTDDAMGMIHQPGCPVEMDESERERITALIEKATDHYTFSGVEAAERVPMPGDPCPCGSGRTFEHCCQPS